MSSALKKNYDIRFEVWENARDLGRLDGSVARSLLSGYLAAVDWPANSWHRWLLILVTKLSLSKPMF